MRNITCRACTAADAATLAALGEQTFCETFEHCNTSEDMRQYISENFTPAALARELAMPQSEFYLAESAGRPAAYMKLNFGAAQTEAHFPGCAEETEPSARTVAFLIDKARELDVPCILMIELSSPMIARVIAEEVGCDVMVFNTMHNATAADFRSGRDYVDMMEENADVLMEALN